MHRCNSCGAKSPKHTKRCGNCGVENQIVPEKYFRRGSDAEKTGIKKLSDFSAKPKPRLVTGFPSLNATLGGGFAVPCVVQFGGEPGIGKSTLLLQIADTLSDKVLYVLNEEPGESLRERADRLRLRNFLDIDVVETSSPEETKQEIIRSECEIAVIDSLQGMSSDDGTVVTQNMTADIALDLCRFAVKMGEYAYRRGSHIALILVCHVNKEAELAGLKKIQHMVDVVAWFRGDPNGKKRVFKVNKSRIGPTHKAAVFTMQEDGLHESLVAEEPEDHAKIDG